MGGERVASLYLIPLSGVTIADMEREPGFEALVDEAEKEWLAGWLAGPAYTRWETLPPQPGDRAPDLTIETSEGVSLPLPLRGGMRTAPMGGLKVKLLTFCPTHLMSCYAGSQTLAESFRNRAAIPNAPWSTTPGRSLAATRFASGRI